MTDTAPQQPQPPYDGVSVPPRWRDVPFDELPRGLQRMIIRRYEVAGSGVVAETSLNSEPTVGL